MNRTTWNRAIVGLLALGTVALAGCILTPAGIQILDLSFSSSETLAEGVEALVHEQVLPQKVVLKKYQVRVSGRIAGADTLPERIDVLVTAAKTSDGKVFNRFKLKVNVDDDGGFVASGKWKKNLEAETLLSVFLTPVGADLEGGADIDLCVHISKQKSALNSIADCAPGSFNLAAADALELDSVGFHELISVGGAFPPDLGSTSGRELVIALRDVTRPNQTCPDEVPWDGCASVDWDDVDGTRNAPPGGGYFENRLTVQTDDGPLELFMNRFLGISPELETDFELG